MDYFPTMGDFSYHGGDFIHQIYLLTNTVARSEPLRSSRLKTQENVAETSEKYEAYIFQGNSLKVLKVIFLSKKSEAFI